MNSLELEVVSRTKAGGAHVKINDGGENLGVLYLDRNQYETIKGILTAGAFQKDVDFIISNPFEDAEDVEDIFDYSE